MSRTLSTNRGSVDSLRVSRRCGCSPKARQMRPTLEVEMPLVPRHAAGAPVRGSGRPALQRLHDDILDLGVVDRARRARPRFVEQPVEAALDKAPAPLADGLHPHPLACRNRLVAQPRGTTQHDPRPQCQGLHRLAPPRIAFQYPRDFTRQFDLRYRATRSHPPPPMQSVVKLIYEFSVQDTRFGRVSIWTLIAVGRGPTCSF